MSIFGRASDRRQGEQDFERNGRYGYSESRYAGHSREDRDYQDGFDDAKRASDAEQADRERELALREREEEAERQLISEIKQRHSQAVRNLARAEEYVSLLEINQKVRDDFFVQWVALGRRSLFELLAIEAEQFSLDTGYFTTLYDGMAGIAYLRATAGELTVDLTPSN